MSGQRNKPAVSMAEIVLGRSLAEADPGSPAPRTER